MTRKVNIIVLFLLIVFCGRVKSQTISINYGYPYYFMQLKHYSESFKVKNEMNYTAGFSYCIYYKSSKVDLGSSFGTKNYLFDYMNTNSNRRKEIWKLSYIILPVSFSQRVFCNTNNSISLAIGITFIRPLRLSKEITFADGSLVRKDNIPVDYKVGNTGRFGIKYSRRISQRIFLFSEAYNDYKFNFEYYRNGSGSEYTNLTKDRFSAGINLGIEWVFNNRELDYYKKK